eukprot:TRINITY_DN8496_c0_g1_i9.p1 TRINITY_DN8496_c0_g1~~TRINITY_DN8496_c0_g1_i9.p1  ORF type:complete len:414 (-),score=71.33 TRINITY_DN8496_c0_g1_i9:155-1396(-)
MYQQVGHEEGYGAAATPIEGFGGTGVGHTHRQPELSEKAMIIFERHKPMIALGTSVLAFALLACLFFWPSGASNTNTDPNSIHARIGGLPSSPAWGGSTPHDRDASDDSDDESGPRSRSVSRGRKAQDDFDDSDEENMRGEAPSAQQQASMPAPPAPLQTEPAALSVGWDPVKTPAREMERKLRRMSLLEIASVQGPNAELLERYQEERLNMASERRALLQDLLSHQNKKAAVAVISMLRSGERQDVKAGIDKALEVKPDAVPAGVWNKQRNLGKKIKNLVDQWQNQITTQEQAIKAKILADPNKLKSDLDKTSMHMVVAILDEAARIGHSQLAQQIQKYLQHREVSVRRQWLPKVRLCIAEWSAAGAQARSRYLEENRGVPLQGAAKSREAQCEGSRDGVRGSVRRCWGEGE